APCLLTRGLLEHREQRAGFLPGFRLDGDSDGDDDHNVFLLPWIAALHRALYAHIGQRARKFGHVANDVLWSIYICRPHVNRLRKRPMPIACIATDVEKEMALLTRRVIRVRRGRCCRSSCWVLRLPRAGVGPEAIDTPPSCRWKTGEGRAGQGKL